jgi:hypothetical protein
VALIKWLRPVLAKTKGECMSNQDNRVLGRIGARDLSTEELDFVAGGTAHTLNCTGIRSTVSGDGDACLDHDVY